MKGYIVDTNVLIELMREVPDRVVLAFMMEQRDLWLSVVSIYELAYAARNRSDEHQGISIRARIDEIVAKRRESILPIDRQVAEEAARMQAEAGREGRELTLADTLIAASAKVNGLGVATRSVSQFQSLGVDVIDPWRPLGSIGSVVHQGTPTAKPDVD